MLSYMSSWFGWVGECFLCQRPVTRGNQGSKTESPVCLDNNKIGKLLFLIRSVGRSYGHFLLLVFGSKMTFHLLRGIVGLVFIVQC